jgi:hypothetical protein
MLGITSGIAYSGNQKSSVVRGRTVIRMGLVNGPKIRLAINAHFVL